MKKTTAICDVCDAEAKAELRLAYGVTMDLCERCSEHHVARAAASLLEHATSALSKEADLCYGIAGAQEGRVYGGLSAAGRASVASGGGLIPPRHHREPRQLMKRFILALALAACSTETAGLTTGDADGGVFVTQQAATASTIRTQLGLLYSGWPDDILSQLDPTYTMARSFTSSWEVDAFVEWCSWPSTGPAVVVGPSACSLSGHIVTKHLVSWPIVSGALFVSTVPGACSATVGNQGNQTSVGEVDYRVDLVPFRDSFASDTGYVDIAWTPRNGGQSLWAATQWVRVNTFAGGFVTAPGVAIYSPVRGGCSTFWTPMSDVQSCHWAACALNFSCTAQPSGVRTWYKACLNGGCSTDQSQSCHWFGDCCPGE